MKNSKLINSFKSSSARSIFKWSKKISPQLIVISLSNMMFTGLSLVFALISKSLVDSAVSHNRSGVIKNGILIFSIILIQCALSFGISKLNAYVRSKLIINMRANFLTQLLKKRYADVEAYHSGELMNRITSDVSVVADGVLGIIPPLVSLLTQLVGAFFILIKIVSFKFVSVLVGAAAFSLILTLLFKKKSKQLHKNVQEADGKVHAVLQESMQNLRLIKASESEKRINEKTAEKQQNYFVAQMKRATFTNFASSGLSFVFRLSWLFAMVWGCFGILNNTFTYGTLTAMTQLVGQIQAPFANMSGLLSRFYSALASAERLDEIYNLPDEEPKTEISTSAENLYNSLDSIDFNNVNFAYNARSEDVLRDVSFEIKPGDFTAVTGLSGGGKSTMFLLLLGIYTPTSGIVSIKTDTSTVKVGTDTRCLFSYVPQGNALFSGTLAENISMFRETATLEEIKTAAKIACIDEFVDELPQKYDTLIGERGLGLSEGQAQRIAVARAILGNAPILLFDEATSALDEETEARLLKNISELKNRTCFIVTHRKAALSICNKQIILENGYVTQKDI